MGLFRNKNNMNKNTANAEPAAPTTMANVSGLTQVALDGYDPVSFFDNDPVNGNYTISYNFEGATYYFANEDNKMKFQANPKHYTPQYGGYCAFGVGAGALLPVDIKTAQVYKDKLYINLNGSVVEMFNGDIDNLIAKADKEWPSLVEQQQSKQ
mmetsp:Transcript_8247/g.18590  ORF Transcript_8247/g.18590 Transcript_8247/m.18590 type:complete len:154 (+) Transcript_8247:221-682(+)